MSRVRIRIFSVICLVLDDQQRSCHDYRFEREERETERQRKGMMKKVLLMCESCVISLKLSH